MEEVKEFRIRNVMEDVVSEKVDNLMEITGACTCSKCRADVMALALNKLPPRYVSTESGGVFSHMEATATQMQAEITVAVMRAIDMVRKSPKH